MFSRSGCIGISSGICYATSDFEDALQVACAVIQGLDAIVTRDATFSATSVPVLSVSQVLQQLEPIE